MSFLDDIAADERRTAELETQAKRSHGRPRKNGAGYRVVKIHCGSCGFIARTTRGALERAGGAPSCCCGAGALELESAQLEQRERCEESEQLERVSVAAMRRHEREQRSGYRTGAVNCAVCGRYKARPADVCETCGDDPVPYGPDRQRDEREHNRSHGYAD